MSHFIPAKLLEDDDLDDERSVVQQTVDVWQQRLDEINREMRGRLLDCPAEGIDPFDDCAGDTPENQYERVA